MLDCRRRNVPGARNGDRDININTIITTKATKRRTPIRGVPSATEAPSGRQASTTPAARAAHDPHGAVTSLQCRAHPVSTRYRRRSTDQAADSGTERLHRAPVEFTEQRTGRAAHTLRCTYAVHVVGSEAQGVLTLRGDTYRRDDQMLPSRCFAVKNSLNALAVSQTPL